MTSSRTRRFFDGRSSYFGKRFETKGRWFLVRLEGRKMTPQGIELVKMLFVGEALENLASSIPDTMLQAVWKAGVKSIPEICDLAKKEIARSQSGLDDRVLKTEGEVSLWLVSNPGSEVRVSRELLDRLVRACGTLPGFIPGGKGS